MGNLESRIITRTETLICSTDWGWLQYFSIELNFVPKTFVRFEIRYLRTPRELRIRDGIDQHSFTLRSSQLISVCQKPLTDRIA